jgi:hypothetical protein
MMTGVKILGSEGGRKYMKSMRCFCKIIIRAPCTTTNEVCVTELGRTNRKEKVVGRVI